MMLLIELALSLNTSNFVLLPQFITQCGVSIKIPA